MEKWINFYEPFFPNRDDATSFVEKYEELCPDGKAHTAKIMMHQTQRLVSLADDIPNIRAGNETLPLLFLLVCAEHIAKLYHITSMLKVNQGHMFVTSSMNSLMKKIKEQ
ncbi:MAG: hypothetical protein HUJ29_10750 [Gammaproteobacteria bacterium]|nr:hypothetical protein [Gammaproteobacteria bacterium]